MILMASQQAIRPGFNTPRHPRKYVLVRQQMSFGGRSGQLAPKPMITVFFTAKKLHVFDVIPRGSTSNPL
jgi:hypothetical protein